MKQQEWSKTTSTIFYGVVIFSFAGIIEAILKPIAKVAGLSSMSVIIEYVMPIAVIVGYVMYFVGLGSFKKLLEGGDGSAIGKVRTGLILSLIATITGWIPVIGWIAGGILNIIGFIITMTGFSRLKKSSSFPDNACKGASKLFSAQILLIIGWIIGLIPLVGGWIEMIFSFIAFVMVLVGWAKIKNTQITAA
ncbi:MAG: hypothetical protein LBH32_11215 [Dysgonamonadaceae bacterium]|jgi:FtsH-binding integral membrane protein|nr:hypothetical protein [Dysgonamonadaceae bacterium]